MWQLEANCSPETAKLFDSELKSKVVKAKALCNSCTVKNKCLEFALDEKIEFGIFGGLTASERIAI